MDNNPIRIVKVNVEVPQLSGKLLSQQGEHLATELQYYLPTEWLNPEYTYRAKFKLPNGDIEYADLEYGEKFLAFRVPQALTLLSGILESQLTIYKESVVAKCYVAYFKIQQSINVPQEVEDKYVGLLESLLEGFVTKPKEVGSAGQVLSLNASGDTVWSDPTGGSQGTLDYNELENIPTLNGKLIQGDLTTADFSIKDGKSAFQIAVDNDFKGTEKEWLESLQGIGVYSLDINSMGILTATMTNGDRTELGKVVGDKGDSYTLTESDKAEIAGIIKTDYDAELLEILGGDEDVAE